MSEIDTDKEAFKSKLLGGHYPYRTDVGINPLTCFGWNGAIDERGRPRFYDSHGKNWIAKRYFASLLLEYELPSEMPIRSMCKSDICMRPEHMGIVYPDKTIEQFKIGPEEFYMKSSYNRWAGITGKDLFKGETDIYYRFRMDELTQEDFDDMERRFRRIHYNVSNETMHAEEYSIVGEKTKDFYVQTICRQLMMYARTQKDGRG